jgi:hypothetical protein
MPPGQPAGLQQQERTAFLRAIADPMIARERDRAAANGRGVVRRLNRYEYETTVRDLLEAPWLVLRDSLPEDGLVARFNKSGGALDISHVQMARYFDAAEQALRDVLAAAREPETSSKHYTRQQGSFIRRMRYGPFNRSPERATIPILDFQTQPEVIAETVPISVGDTDPTVRELEGYATPAGTFNGNEYHWSEWQAPSGGIYQLRFNAFSIWLHTVWDDKNKNRPAWWRPNRQSSEKGRTVEPVSIYALAPGGEKRYLGSFDVTPEPGVHTLTVELLKGEMIRPDAARLVRTRPGWVGSPHATKEGMPGVAYRWLEVDGPVQSPQSRQRIVRMFDAKAGAEPLLREFMARAYRRPPAEGEVQRYLAIVNQQLTAGQNVDFTEAMIAGYTAVLCSPGFLYLEEDPGLLNGHAIASRLSYFLWNGPPDAELRALAANGTITQPEILRAQTDRVLAAPRSRDFVNAFLDYWLDLRKIADTTPDVILYPDYYLDDLLTESALFETQKFFDHLLRENLPVATLADSDFAMLNSHLAQHYGLPPVEGVAIRKVSLPEGSVRGGLLTQASVLKVTANGTTTSPVLRGAWIMERILGDPPSPPPPGVQAVEPDTRGAVTIRQQLDKHRSVASCAGCHKKIDPPGFALESFDVVGGWRNRYRSTGEGEDAKGIGKNGHAFTFKYGQPVDSSGKVASGEEFRDIREFKQLLLMDERALARNMVKQFVAYGTGTPVRFGDREAVERILDLAAKDRYRMRTLIHEIVQSKLFREK